MNEKLLQAEVALTQFLSEKPQGASLDEILREFCGKIDESELRAAVWTLKASGAVDFHGDKLQKAEQALAA